MILIYDQLLFRPLVAWADHFRFEQEAGVTPPHSWALTMLRRSWLGGAAKGVVRVCFTTVGPGRAQVRQPGRTGGLNRDGLARWIDRAWYAAVAVLAALAFWKIAGFI